MTRTAFYVVSFLAVFAVALYVGLRTSGSSSPTVQPIDRTQRAARVEAGDELVLVLVVSTRCRWSNHPELVSSWEAISHKMRESVADHLRFTTIGIAEAATPRHGAAFLERFGEFDEISTGHALNAGAIRYVVNDLRGPVAYPQIILLERQFATREDGFTYRAYEKVGQRIVGLEAIKRAAARLDHIAVIPTPANRNLLSFREAQFQTLLNSGLTYGSMRRTNLGGQRGRKTAFYRLEQPQRLPCAGTTRRRLARADHLRRRRSVGSMLSSREDEARSTGLSKQLCKWPWY